MLGTLLVAEAQADAGALEDALPQTDAEVAESAAEALEELHAVTAVSTLELGPDVSVNVVLSNNSDSSAGAELLAMFLTSMLLVTSTLQMQCSDRLGKMKTKDSRRKKKCGKMKTKVKKKQILFSL